jgi:5'-3' exonuclease
MEVFLIDGTYELFRHYYALPSARTADGEEVAAVRGVVGSIGAMLKTGVTHIGVATDYVIESFRNELWSGYKTGAGIPRDLWSQFRLLENALTAMGVVVWPMVEFEADDALASAAEIAARDARVTRIVICTPDKDLAQCVSGTRVVQMDRRKRVTRDERGVVEKFGVPPALIPDYLALVGDSSDGYPGLRGWGPKTAAMTLMRFGHIDDIPIDRLGPELREQALLFRELATLRRDIPLFESVDALEWREVRPEFAVLTSRFDSAVTSTAKRSPIRP